MAQMMLVNPRKRKRRKVTKKKASPRRRTTLARARSRAPARRRRRNPIKMSMKNVMKTAVMPSATAATGALVVDLALGYIPLPDMLKHGPARHLVKGVAAIGMGLLASNFVKPRTAELFATGALTVAMYDAAKQAIGQFAPNIKMGEYDFDTGDLGYSSPGLIVDENDSMGYYESEVESMGFYEGEEIDL